MKRRPFFFSIPSGRLRERAEERLLIAGLTRNLLHRPKGTKKGDPIGSPHSISSLPLRSANTHIYSYLLSQHLKIDLLQIW